MNITMDNLKSVINTPTVKSLVSSWLLQKALSEMLREKVDKVYAEVLNEIPLYDDTCLKFKRFKDHPRTRITKVKDMYLSIDEDACLKVYDLVDKLLRERGIKPPEMEHDFCPALVAESDLSEIEHTIIEVTGNPFGVTVDKLLLHGSLESYDKWIDLVVKAIVNQDDFENPLVKIGLKK